MSKVFFCPYCDKYIDNSYFARFVQAIQFSLILGIKKLTRKKKRG